MSRLKKVLLRTAIVLSVLVAIGLVANACFVWITDTRLERQLAEIRAAGDPISLADLARKPIQPEKNAATYLRQAEAGVEAILREIYSKGFHSGWGNQWNESEAHILSPEGAKAIRKAWNAHPKAMPLLEQAAACPDYEPGFDYTGPAAKFIFLPGNAEFRHTSYALQFRAYMFVAERNNDEATRTALMIFRLGRLYERNPGLVAYLIAITVQGTAIDAVNVTLHSGPVSKAVGAALDAELARQDPMSGFVWAMRSGRATHAGWFQDAPLRNFWLVNRGLWNQRESDYLERTQVALAVLRESSSYRATRNAFGAPVNLQAIPDGERMELLQKEPFLGYGVVYDGVVGHRAKIRCLRVLNALQTHVPTGSTDVPKVTELGLPADTITDPFTGQPLHVKKTPRGWLVYSVGQNLKDDGGTLDDKSDIGVGPPSSPNRK